MTTLSRILHRLESPDEGERIEALLELVRVQGPAPLDRLFRLATEDPSPGVRYYARRAFGSLKAAAGAGREGPAPAPPDAPGAAPAPGEEARLASLAQDLGALDPRRRLAAVRRAVADPAPTFVPLLAAALPRESSVEVRAALVAAIGRLGGPAETALLAPFLGDRDHRVRANAVDALAAIGSEEAIVQLIPAVQDPDHRVQTNAARALAGVEGTSIPRLLRALALDGEVWNRDAALHALDSLDAPFALRLLAEMARGDAVQRLRAKARACLERRATAGQALARHLLEGLPPEG
ncbi:MAG: HEAT repeat domain-containing protein [Candidatus Riflebacteria bacterium]|nr:HEAT repeat domain-containing protein [Candidatus Riflebacteria bacterium]